MNTIPLTLVAWYKFNDSTNLTLDSSGNNYDLTNNAARFDSNNFKTGTGSVALNVNDNEYLTFNANIDFGKIANTNGITFALWLKLQNQGGSWWFMCIGNSYGSDILWYRITNAGFFFMITVNDKNVKYNIFDNQWHHIVWCVASDGKWTVYLDNVNQNVNIFQKIPVNLPGIRTIGLPYSSADGYAKGNIDDFRIYNRVLTAHEVDMIYNSANVNNIVALNGNIGVDSNIPNYRLDVNGTINATEYRLNGNVFTGGGSSSSQWTNLNNTIAWYKLNGNLNDSSGNNSNISYVGTEPQYDTNDYKVPDKSIIFNGNNYLRILNNGNFSPDSFTIMVWLYYIQDAPRYLRTVLMSCYDFNRTPRTGYYIYIDGANNRIYIWTDTVANADPIFLMTSNNWYHIAITFNKSDGKINLYINGIYIASRTHSYYNNNSSYFYIGYQDNYGTINQGNKMNDFRFYSRILSASEISDIYTNYNNDIQDIFHTSGNVGIGTSYINNYKLSVWGDIYAQNIVYAGDDVVAGYSDIRLKNIVGNIENSLDKISNINVFRYLPNELANSYAIKSNNIEIGVSAQDLHNVLPEVVKLAPFDTCNLNTGQIVSKSGENYLTVKYERIVPLLIEGIKELKKNNDNLRKRIEALETL